MSDAAQSDVTPGELEVQRHPAIVRIAHWTMALSVILMIGSGWRIYNAVPILPFRFPEMFTLGGNVFHALAAHNDPGVASAIAWHFAAMWLLFASFLTYVLYGVIAGHFRRDFLPVGPRGFIRDFIAAATFRLAHRLGEYNAVQKVFYWSVILAITVMIVSGLAIWKPVQLAFLTSLFGGFQGARIIHFAAMSGIVLFIAVHVTLVALVPKTLVAMVLGRATARPHGQKTGA
jgi:thiosulfate reductase cytochrome b subunit